MIKLKETRRIEVAIVRNVSEKVSGARIENAENIQKKNKMLLWRPLRSMAGDSPLTI